MGEESKKKLMGYVSRYEWETAGLSVCIDYAKIGELADYFSEKSVLVDGDHVLRAYVQVDAVCTIFFQQYLRCAGVSFREIVDMFPDGTSGHWIMRLLEGRDEHEESR